MCRASAPMALLRREWGGRAGGCPPPRWGGAFLRSLSRPNRATGWFDPATPLQVSPRIFAAHAGTRTNHGTFQPCAGTSVASVHLYKAGASQYINYFVLPLSYSAQERPLPQAYAPCGCEARGHAYGADGWARTNGIHSTWRSNRLSYVCMRGVPVFPGCHRCVSAACG